jgi:hypothetical protein
MYPDEVEFWKLEEPIKFKIYCPNHADYRKFKTWLRKEIKTLLELKPATWTKDQEVNDRFLSQYSYMLLESYEQKETIETDPAIFKFKFTDFMTKDEIKKLPENLKTEPLSPP